MLLVAHDAPAASKLWYPLSELPVGRVRVRVNWSGRVFLSTRGIDPRTQSWGWCVYRAGTIVWLPEDGDQKMSSEPSCWQPEDLNAWPYPLENPLPLIEPRLWYAKQGFSAVQEMTDAEAAELAAEVHEMREAARANADQDDTDDAWTGRWWWSDRKGAIRYEPAGSITRVMAEGRLMRAIAMSGGPGVKIPTRNVTLTLLVAESAGLDAATMAEVARNRAEEAERELTRFRPTPQDIADFPIAMEWFAALNPPAAWKRRRKAWTFNRAQQVLWYRASDRPVSFSDLAEKYDVTKQAVAKTYAAAIDKCWEVANRRRSAEMPLTSCLQAEAVRTGQKTGQ